MTATTLRRVLQAAQSGGYAVAGFVVLGWEDARAFVAAAEAEGAPVILQAGPACRGHTPLPVLGQMFRYLAEQADVPVVAHLDHSTSPEECRRAIDAGFTSVMYDGSRRSLSENIDVTSAVVEMAHAVGVSVEGEVGFVGYAQGEVSAVTRPTEAARFAAETRVDALAVSVGNVHLQKRKEARIDFAALSAIEAATDVPLVLHGVSGITTSDRQRLARETHVCKLNIGTELRMCFGKALRAALAADPTRFDRLALLQETEEPMRRLAQRLIREIAPGQRVVGGGAARVVPPPADEPIG